MNCRSVWIKMKKTLLFKHNYGRGMTTILWCDNNDCVSYGTDAITLDILALALKMSKNRNEIYMT